MGLYHCTNILNCPEAKIVAVSDINKNGYQSLINLSNETKNIKFYDDPFNLINDNIIDAVLIASPDSTHYELLKMCLIKRKKVFCEKPIATTSKQALDIVNIESQLNEKYIALGFNRRFDKNFRKIKKILTDLEIGDSLLYKGIHRNDKAFYEANTSFILNNTAGHDVDISSYLLNSKPKKVNVLGIKSNPLLNDDCADLLLLTIIFENNKLANIEIFVNARYGYEVEGEVICTKGVINYCNNKTVTIKRDNKKENIITSDYRKYFEQSYKDEIHNWISYLNVKTELQLATAYDGYTALKTTEVAAKSYLSKEFENVDLIKTPILYI